MHPEGYILLHLLNFSMQCSLSRGCNATLLSSPVRADPCHDPCGDLRNHVSITWDLMIHLTSIPVASFSIGRFVGVNPKGLGKATSPPPKAQETQLDIFRRAEAHTGRFSHLKPRHEEVFGRSPGASEDFSTGCRLMSSPCHSFIELPRFVSALRLRNCVIFVLCF